jgi:tRNA nucleotidyltransferase (CCA-adding enzyme)
MPRWDYSKLPDFMETNLPPYAMDIIFMVSAAAAELGVKAYLVGGGARELLRAFVEQTGVENLRFFLFDVDIAVEGNAIALAEAVAARKGGDVTRNPQFLTAKWITPQGYAVDFAACRSEEYPIPGELPEVTGGVEIYEDLMRRDFTCNALGVSISKEDFGYLYDPSGGVGDIFMKTLRVLHKLSFFEDPTRLARAIRYSTRLSYKFDENTAELFFTAIEESYLDMVSPERVRYELERIFTEEYWFGMMWSAQTSDLLASIHPTWLQLPTYSGSDAEVLELGIRNQADVLEQEIIPKWMVRLSWTLKGVLDDALPPLLERTGMHSRLAKHMLEAREREDELVKRMNHWDFKPSRIYRVLQEYPRKALLFAAFNSYLIPATEALRHNLFLYLRELSPRQAVVSGEMLMEMGIPEGPLVGKAQEELWWMKLDGVLEEESSAEAAARKLAELYRAMPSE